MELFKTVHFSSYFPLLKNLTGGVVTMGDVTSALYLKFRGEKKKIYFLPRGAVPFLSVVFPRSVVELPEDRWRSQVPAPASFIASLTVP